MKRKIIYSIIAVLIVTAVASGSIYALARDKKDVFTEKECKEIAEEFIRNSPTFSFDGYGLQHSETLYPEIADKPYLWTFVFEFKSTHGGYGDRSGQIIEEEITPHEAHISVDSGKVTSAVLDLKWDMLSQKTIN